MRPDSREVVAHAAAAAHRLGRFGQGDVDAGVALVVADDRIAHGLHEAIDERGRQRGAGRRLDAPCGQETVAQGLPESHGPGLALRRLLSLREGARHAGSDVVDPVLAFPSVFLHQHVAADRLQGQCGKGPDAGGIAGHGRSLRAPVRQAQDAFAKASTKRGSSRRGSRSMPAARDRPPPPKPLHSVCAPSGCVNGARTLTT